MKKSFIKLLVLMLATMLVFVACRQSADEESTLVVVLPAYPLSLDNTLANEANSLIFHYNVVETLVKFDGHERNIVPGLAERWEMPDAQTVIMYLRRGIRFHNGDEMKASDVAFSIMRGSVAQQTRILLHPIESIDVIDDYTVKINMSIPFVPIMASLTHPGAGITPERVVTELGAEYPNNPVGTGPFKFSSMVIGDYVEIVRNEDYWGEAPLVDRIRFIVVPEAANRLIEIETGAAHIAFDISPHAIPRLQSDPNLAYNRAENTRVHFLGFNLQSPTAVPLRDIRVRQAIAHAIDVPAIADAVFAGLGRVTHGPMVGLPEFVVNFPGREYNLERARQLMAEAGYPNGFSVTLYNAADVQTDVDQAIIVQNMLRQINIDVQLVSMEFVLFLHETREGAHDMNILNWGNIQGDPDYGMVLYHTMSIGGGNRFRYVNLELDRLLDLGRQELNAVRRYEIYREAQEMVYRDLPALFLLHGEELVALSPRIQNFDHFPPRFPMLDRVRIAN